MGYTSYFPCLRGLGEFGTRGGVCGVSRPLGGEKEEGDGQVERGGGGGARRMKDAEMTAHKSKSGAVVAVEARFAAGRAGLVLVGPQWTRLALLLLGLVVERSGRAWRRLRAPHRTERPLGAGNAVSHGRHHGERCVHALATRAWQRCCRAAQSLATPTCLPLLLISAVPPLSEFKPMQVQIPVFASHFPR